jgi:hypothetical protein
MAGRARAADAPSVTAADRDTAVVDLAALRRDGERAVAAVAAARVRHLPAELLDALQGSWGTPEELGLLPVRRLGIVS